MIREDEGLVKRWNVFFPDTFVSFFNLLIDQLRILLIIFA